MPRGATSKAEGGVGKEDKRRREKILCNYLSNDTL